MGKYKQNGKKSERISIRCTKKEKEQLLKRANDLEMEITEYVCTLLFPKESYEDIKGYSIGLIVDIQDLIMYIKKMYSEDNIQEEADCIWKKIKASL